MSSFGISLSGLLAEDDALSSISNNIANLNTVGYKATAAQFQDLFYQQVGANGAGNPIQLGVGTSVGSISTNFNQGTPDSTGIASDLAIQGDGFFQVQKDNLTLYTRDGSFGVDPQGYLTTANGAQLMGYPVQNGVVNKQCPSRTRPGEQRPDKPPQSDRQA
jgi:flagellar hook protein FlgE